MRCVLRKLTVINGTTIERFFSTVDSTSSSFLFSRHLNGYSQTPIYLQPHHLKGAQSMPSKFENSLTLMESCLASTKSKLCPNNVTPKTLFPSFLASARPLNSHTYLPCLMRMDT